MSKFQPPFTLTSAQRCMRSQLRSVQGAHTRNGTTASTAAARRARPRSSKKPASPSDTRIDCGRTKVATPKIRPASSAPRAVPRIRHRANVPSTSRFAVTASVISAGV